MSPQGLMTVDRFVRDEEGRSLEHIWPLMLERVTLFIGLSKRHLRRVARLAEVRRFDDGAPVVHFRGPGDAFYVILDGSATVTPYRGQVKQIGIGGYFGELALLDGEPRSEAVTAGSDLITARIGRTQFIRLIREEPAIAVGLTRGLVCIVHDMQEEAGHVQERWRLGEEQAGTALETRTALGWQTMLWAIPVFSALSKRSVQRITELVELKRYSSGAAVVKAGAPGDAFYVILEGVARVETQDHITRTLAAGEFFGELALFDGAPRSATVTASDYLTVARVGRTAFQKLLRDQPALGIGLSQGLVAIIRDLQHATD
jgi:CRP-like cAMP-binding protein